MESSRSPNTSAESADRLRLRRSERIALVVAGIAAAGAVVYALMAVGTQTDPPDARDKARSRASDEPGPTEKTDGGVRESLDTYRSDGKDVRIECYLPLEKGKYPAIIALHGGGGISPGGGGMRDHCRQFTRRGYAVFIPHYFDQTNTVSTYPAMIDQLFVTWMGTVGKAIDYVQAHAEVDGDRVGLIGWSLGSAQALEVAATHSGVAAVVGNFGGMDKRITDKMTHMPPTLLLDGEDDQLYPVALARQLYKTLKRKHVEVESKIYPGQGHGFSGEAAVDSERRTNAFFDKHLAKSDEK
jgi:carboxymethylenebutenolidase